MASEMESVLHVLGEAVMTSAHALEKVFEGIEHGAISEAKRLEAIADELAKEHANISKKAAEWAKKATASGNARQTTKGVRDI